SRFALFMAGRVFSTLRSGQGTGPLPAEIEAEFGLLRRRRSRHRPQVARQLEPTLTEAVDILHLVGGEDLTDRSAEGGAKPVDRVRVDLGPVAVVGSQVVVDGVEVVAAP